MNGEAKVLTPAQAYNVDGFHVESNTLFEYHGCIYQGCRKCYPKQGNLKRFCHPDRTVDEVYEATLKKTAILRYAGYNVIEMWGCKWSNLKETDPEVADFVKSFQHVLPLEPRDAFLGGRTGAVTLYAKTTEDEEISYVDFTSLYPSINKYGTYPVGFPRIMYQPVNQNIHDYFGIAQVDILAPERLYHPVLPVRAGENLLFLSAGPVLRKSWPSPCLNAATCAVIHASSEYSKGPGVPPNSRKRWKKAMKSRKYMRCGTFQRKIAVRVYLLGT